METNYFEFYSNNLNRTMPLKVYGHAGRPVLFIPCQDGRFFDFENFHLTDTFAPWIDSGKVIVFAIDTIDIETWSDKNGDPYYRIRHHEEWINYITREVVPFIRDYVNEKNGWEGYPGIMTFGCSMGLSGIYHASYFFGDYMDEVVYNNSITDYMSGMSNDHPFIARYNNNKAVVCVGMGVWEEPWSTQYLDKRFHELGINIWVDYWGSDVNHDWPWWYKQVPYFLPYLLEGE